jgi:hypothetical protein
MHSLQVDLPAFATQEDMDGTVRNFVCRRGG